jgi:hypothetical protein
MAGRYPLAAWKRHRGRYRSEERRHSRIGWNMAHCVGVAAFADDRTVKSAA